MLYQESKSRLSAKQWQCVGVLGGILLFGFVFIFIPAIFGGGPRITMAPSDRAQQRLDQMKARSYVSTLKDKIKFTEQLIKKQETVNDRVLKDLQKAELDKAEFLDCVEKITTLNECLKEVRRLVEANALIQDSLKRDQSIQNE